MSIEDDHDFLLALHQTQLVSWLAHTLGRAILWTTFTSLAVALGAGIVASATGDFSFVGLIGIVAPLTFGWILYGSQAPLPEVSDD